MSLEWKIIYHEERYDEDDEEVLESHYTQEAQYRGGYLVREVYNLRGVITSCITFVKGKDLL